MLAHSEPGAEAFPELPPYLQGLAARGITRMYRRGTLLIEEGTRGDSVYLIQIGLLRAFSNDARGREITYAHFGPGEYVGETCLDGGLHCANVIAMDDCHCIRLTRVSVLAHMEAHPEFATAWLYKSIQRTRLAMQSIKTLALSDVYERLKALLDEEARHQHPEDPVLLQRVTHQAMAQRLGCSREMVSKLMKGLEAGGYLVRAGRGRYQKIKALPARW
ncbi:MAG: Crp/Fnr family transcriptional regulator [Burkholderiaceae bacterium]|nr:Crp/Fnr family transcriptional regulator [Burkholderiaceae bacterium]